MADELFVNVFGSVARTELKQVSLRSLSVRDLKERVYQTLSINRSEHGKQLSVVMAVHSASVGSSVCASNLHYNRIITSQ